MSDVNDEPEKKRDQKVLLIGGAMRSGTTIVHRALCQAKNTNPYISESWYLRDLFSMYAANLRHYDMRHQDQFGDQSKFDELTKYNLNFYLDTVSAKYDHPELLVLKHPDLTQYFPLIRRLAPGIKFLVIVRDPRDVIASIKSVGAKLQAQGVRNQITMFKTMTEYCNFYMHQYGAVMAHRPEFKDDLLFFRYEDIVLDPMKAFAQLGAFSGAVFEGDEMTKFDQDKTESKYLTREVRLQDSISSAFWSEMYTSDLSADAIGKHKGILSPSEIREIEHMLAGMGSKFNYW